MVAKGGISYQELPKDERTKLTINGEAVVELDYPAMHPHLMCAWKQQCPDDFYERLWLGAVVQTNSKADDHHSCECA